MSGVHPVAGGGYVVICDPHDHADGRRTSARLFYGPDGQFEGVMQMDLTPPSRADLERAISPEANLRAALAYMRERYTRPWTVAR